MDQLVHLRGPGAGLRRGRHPKSFFALRPPHEHVTTRPYKGRNGRLQVAFQKKHVDPVFEPVERWRSARQIWCAAFSHWSLRGEPAERAGYCRPPRTDVMRWVLKPSQCMRPM